MLSTPANVVVNAIELRRYHKVTPLFYLTLQTIPVLLQEKTYFVTHLTQALRFA